MIDTLITGQIPDSAVDYSGSTGNVYHDYKIKFEKSTPSKAANNWTTEHKIHPQTHSPALSRMEYSNDWVIVTLLLSVTILGWIQFFFKKSFNQTLMASFVYKDAATLYKNQNSVSNRISLIMNFLFFINFSVYLLLFIEKNSGSQDGIERITRFGLIVGVLAVYILVKNFLYYSTAVLFDILKIVKEYVYNGSIYNKLAGVLILPIILAYAFLPEEIAGWVGYLGILVFILTYLMQLIRGFQIILRNGYTLTYGFLYLLTIELLPLALLVKWVLIRSS